MHWGPSLEFYTVSCLFHSFITKEMTSKCLLNYSLNSSHYLPVE